MVRQGNEHVVLARFADANFFVREDLKHKLEDFRPRLGTLMFQKKLGSMLDKNERIEKLTETLIPMLGLDADEAVFARRAAHLLKADLVSKMVVEMTSLQGVMGGEYARREGEALPVVKAIRRAVPAGPADQAGFGGGTGRPAGFAGRSVRGRAGSRPAQRIRSACGVPPSVWSSRSSNTRLNSTCRPP